jgi:hypothetical protein
MANREINLLVKHEGELSQAQKKQLAQVKKWVPLGLFVYLVLLLVVIGANLFVAQQDKFLTRRISTVSDEIEKLTESEGIYLILKQKLGAISRILKTRYEYLTVFDFFKGLEVDNGRITHITLERNGRTDIEFSVNNSEAMDRVVTSIVNEAKSKFTSVKLLSVKLSENGSYLIELNIQV